MIPVRAALAVSLVLVGGCGVTDPAGARLNIAGEDPVRVGTAVTLTPEGDGSASLKSYALTWTVSDPTVASLHTTGSISAPTSRALIGLKAGSVTVTMTNGSVSASRQFTVVDERAVVHAVLGQDVTGHLLNGVGEQRIAFALSAGDTIDLSVTSDSVAQNQIRLVSADGLLPLGGSLASTRSTIYGAVVAPRTGTYLVGVSSGLKCTSWGSCQAVGPYTVRSRRSAPLFNLVFRPTDVRVPQGTIVLDTAWLQNVGTGTLVVQAGVTSTWLRPDASSVAVPGPAQEPSVSDSIPAGSVPFTSTIDTRNLVPGVYSDTVGFTVPSSPWTDYGAAVSARRYVNLRVYDPLARIVSRSFSLSLLSAMTDGRLLSGSGDTLFIVNPITGAIDPLLRVATDGPALRIGRVVGGLDGAVYFGAGSSLYRVEGGAPVSILSWNDPWGFGFVVLPDGTLYWSHDLMLVRLPKGGTAEVVASVGGTFIPQTLVYHPAENALFFAGRGPLRRYDIATRVVESRSSRAFESVLAIDAQGHLYANAGPTIFVLDTSGQELSQFVPPCSTNGIAITGGVIYGACPGYFWSMPVR